MTSSCRLLARSFGGADFSNYFIPLAGGVTATTLEAAREQGAVFAYGNFLTVLINFLILAWIIFLMVKAVNSMRAKQQEAPAAPVAPPQDIALLTENPRSLEEMRSRAAACHECG